MSSIELVLYAPLLMFMTFLVVQMSLAYLGNQVASAAAREGARVARVQGGTPAACAAGAARAREMVTNVGKGLLVAGDITVVPVGADDVRATVRGTATEIIPVDVFTVTQVVQGPIERFRPDL